MTRMKALAVAVLTTLVFGSVAIGITANSDDVGPTEAALPVTGAQGSGLSPDAAPAPTQEGLQGAQIASGGDDREDGDDDGRDQDGDDNDHEDDRDGHDDRDDDDD